MAKGRKKKVVQQEETVIQGTQSINYQGSISLSINNGKKVLMRKKYHNSGMPNLFRYLANCLAGNNSDNLRPVKIKLFYSKDTDTPPNAFNWANAWATTSLTAVSPYILFDSTPYIKHTTDDESAEYVITFHFRVPFSYISGDTIHLIGLFTSDATDDKQDVSAYYLLSENDEWSPIDLSSASTNYSLIIEWSLKISNKTANKTAN